MPRRTDLPRPAGITPKAVAYHRLNESLGVHRKLLGEAERIVALADALATSLRRGGQVFFFGNGGSAADAQHLAAELVGRYYLERRPLAATALSVNTSALTAIGNDYSFEEVFARQLEAAGRPGDVAVGLSTSGNSPNVVEALRVARLKGMVTVALTGGGGGAVRNMADHWLPAPSEDTPRIQEAHILIGHIVCELVERALVADEAAAAEDSLP